MNGRTSKPKLLACCDAPQAHTGFGTVARHVLKLLEPDWDIHIMALNWDGHCPDHSTFPYRYYNPAPKNLPAEQSIDLLGMKYLGNLAVAIQPDLLLHITDIATLARRYHQDPRLAQYRSIAFTAFEADNFPRWWLNGVMQVDANIVFTDWAAGVLRSKGVWRETYVVPHGHDSSAFHPLWRTMEERTALRQQIGIPEDTFIVLRADRNEFRKNWPETLKAFRHFLINTGAEDAFLYPHTPWDDPFGWNMEDMLDVWGGEELVGHVMSTKGFDDAWFTTSQKNLNLLYNVADLHFTTTGGEAWGLTTHEAKAAGLPVAGPRHTGIAEVLEGGWQFGTEGVSYNISAMEYYQTNIREAAAVMQKVYEDVKGGRAKWFAARERGLEWAKDRTWENALASFPGIVNQVMSMPRLHPLPPQGDVEQIPGVTSGRPRVEPVETLRYEGDGQIEVVEMTDA